MDGTPLLLEQTGRAERRLAVNGAATSVLQSSGAAAKIKVIYITGRGRSGSTILDNALGQFPGFFSAGEIALGGRRLEQDGLCGCRAAVRTCPIWSEALRRAFGASDLAQAAMKELFAIGRKGTDWLEVMAGSTDAQTLRRRHRLALEHMASLYEAIANVAGCRIIVDSSKSPLYGFALSLLPQLDFYALHLVRDPRAVSYSWLRQKSARPATDDPLHRRSIGSVSCSWRWMLVNSAAEALLGRLGERYKLLRYEDFVRRPAAVLADILAWAGESGSAPASLNTGRLHLARNHTISGNPNRFRTGEIRLELDDEWRRQMTPLHRRVSSAITWPLRSRYGYVR